MKTNNLKKKLLKKKLSVVLLIAAVFAFAACNTPAEDSSTVSGSSSIAAATSTASSAPAPTYKETMVPYDQVVQAERIIILQNLYNPSAYEGFFTRETRTQAVEIDYNGGKASAYAITPAIELLHNGCAGTVTVTKTDATSVEMSAADFIGMYAMFDLRSAAPPILYNPSTATTVTDFAYAITSEGEAVYSVVSGSEHVPGELYALVGWPADSAYRFVATDKFHFPVEPADAGTGKITGALSGAVNASFPNMTIASGKINDVLFIEKITE